MTFRTERVRIAGAFGEFDSDHGMHDSVVDDALIHRVEMAAIFQNSAPPVYATALRFLGDPQAWLRSATTPVRHSCPTACSSAQAPPARGPAAPAQGMIPLD